jgi:hypothetical protein
MIKGLAAEDGDLALDRLPRAGLCHLGFLSMKLILVVRSVSVVMALTGHSASRRDRRQANRQRLRQLDHALGTRVCLRRPPPSRHLQRGGRSVGPAQLLREWALASVDDPNTTLAIFEWSAEDGCAVDDWDAIAQGTPGLGYTVSHEAILSLLAMDPPPVFRTEVMCQNILSLDEPVSPLAWSSCADQHQGRRAPALIMSRKPVRLECVTQCRGLIRWSRREKSNRLRDRLDLIVAGTTSPSPSAVHIIDHLVAGAPEEEATKCREPSRTPITNCPL